MISILYIRSPELLYFVIDRLYPWPHLPISSAHPPASGNHHSTLYFYQLGLFPHQFPHIQCLSFCAWFISFSIMCFHFVHVVINDRLYLFFMAKRYPIYCVCVCVCVCVVMSRYWGEKNNRGELYNKIRIGCFWIIFLPKEYS